MKIIIAGLQFSNPLTKRKTTDTIVLHHAEASRASVGDIHNWHLGNGWAGIGYHYYVRKDGSVYEGRPENTIGSHAGSKSGYNSSSIGICFEGNYQTEIMPSVQLTAGLQLITQIESSYDHKLRIVGHRDVTSTDCPGKNFPLSTFQQYRQVLNTPTESKEETMVVYKNLSDVPEWGKASVTKAKAKVAKNNPTVKVLSGEEDGLNLSEDVLRVIVMLDRLGLFD